MKRTVVAGSFHLVVQQKPKARWRPLGSVCFDPNWVVRFHLPGLPVRAESARLPVCAACLDLRRADTPSYHERCGCRRPVLEWAEARLRRLVHEWQESRVRGELEPMAPRARVPLARVGEVYLKCGLVSAADNWRALCLVYEVGTGKEVSEGFVDELTAEVGRRFAALYQEYGRRGWSVRGTAPVDAWAQLRRLDPAPVLDWERPERWNTTIRTTLRCAKSVLGQMSRDKYLHGLARELPRTEGFLRMTMAVPVPDTRVMMDPGTLARMHGDLPVLKKQDLRCWAAVKLGDETGCRTVELAGAQRSWLEIVDVPGRSRAFTIWTDEPKEMVALVVRNRGEEFRLKSRRSMRVRVIPLSGELVEAVQVLMAEGGLVDGSIFGLPNKTAVENLLRRANAWVGQYTGVGATHKMYQLRKIQATAQTRVHGATAGSDALGHEAESRVTRAQYVKPESVVRSLTPEERVGALGTGRRPWSAR